MYTQKQVEDVLSQVEQEFDKALESVKKRENTEEVEAEASADEVIEEGLEKNEETEVIEDEGDYETIEDLYSSMEKSEIEAHYASIKKVMFGSSEEQEETIAKSEDQNEKAEEEQTLSKAEEELNKVKSENEELKKSLDQVNGLLEKLFNKEKSAPKGKALTGYDVISKSEDSQEEKEDVTKLSKNEITKKLNSIDYATLSKSDRTAINEYCLENGSVNKIKHLIME